MRRFVIGDIHGNYKALMQCIERSNFNFGKDFLIVLGDIVDGLPQSIPVIHLLMNMENVVLVLGNHDLWFWDYLKTGATPELWLSQGGRATLKSLTHSAFVPTYDKMIKFFNESVNYYITSENQAFVHGGFPYHKDLQDVPRDTLIWDRDLVQQAFMLSGGGVLPEAKLGRYEEVFVGHTTTRLYKAESPLKLGNVWMLDTDAGYKGKLTIMDIDTKEYWQSDNVLDLYPDYLGR